MTIKDARRRSALVQETGEITIHFRSGQPVVLHGTVTRWRHRLPGEPLRPNDRPMITVPGLKVPYIDWPNVTVITVKEDPSDDDPAQH